MLGQMSCLENVKDDTFASGQAKVHSQHVEYCVVCVLLELTSLVLKGLICR